MSDNADKLENQLKVNNIDDALNIMENMGDNQGTKLEDGREILKPLEQQINLNDPHVGFPNIQFEPKLVRWDSKFQNMDVNEDLKWVSSSEYAITSIDFLQWLKKDVLKKSIDNETNFCDAAILKDILQGKQIFEELNPIELSKARKRANPFETIQSAFFMNRAALKMANIDAATNFMFTDVDRDPRHKQTKNPYYFADICAGPGGFSEYILWRKRWAFKGFGFTLKGIHDFKVHESLCCSGVTFQPFYGAADDGDVTNPDNIRDFAKKVLFETDDLGVHFVMADGGFSVEGNENLQEVLSKQLYVCQCLVGLEIVRTHGHFVSKVFDIFTLFSVGLIYLMYQCFDKIAILKPNSSRPANAERYLICSGLKDLSCVQEIRKYMRKIVEEFWYIKTIKKDDNLDIEEIVPLDVIGNDKQFMQYITDRNNMLGKQQINGLAKLATFCRNPKLIEPRQAELRSHCLAHWRIPDKKKAIGQKISPDDILAVASSRPEFLYAQPREITNSLDLTKIISDISDWSYIPLFCSRETNTSNIYIGTNGSKTYRLQKYKWVRVKNIQLIKGTILYGDIVNEKLHEKNQLDDIVRKSLHVIDALRLGDTSLADLPFQERLSLVSTYCKAINFESNQKKIRIRPKVFDSLGNIISNNLIQYNSIDGSYFTKLPAIGFQSINEQFRVNSLLFMKTDENQFFNSTYVLRANLFIEQLESSESEETYPITYDAFIKYVENK